MDQHNREFIRVNSFGGIVQSIEHYATLRNATYLNEMFDPEVDDIRVFRWDLEQHSVEGKGMYVEVWSHPNELD